MGGVGGNSGRRTGVRERGRSRGRDPRNVGGRTGPGRQGLEVGTGEWTDWGEFGQFEKYASNRGQFRV